MQIFEYDHTLQISWSDLNYSKYSKNFTRMFFANGCDLYYITYF